MGLGRLWGWSACAAEVTVPLGLGAQRFSARAFPQLTTPLPFLGAPFSFCNKLCLFL